MALGSSRPAEIRTDGASPVKSDTEIVSDPAKCSNFYPVPCKLLCNIIRIQIDILGLS